MRKGKDFTLPYGKVVDFLVKSVSKTHSGVMNPVPITQLEKLHQIDEALRLCFLLIV
ncbi:MAG: hypothetical protein AAGH81_03400 [Bacteroidota bacterium]